MVVYTTIMKIFRICQLYRMRIDVTLKVKNFEINPIFAKKSYSEKTDWGGGTLTPPLRGIGLKAQLIALSIIDNRSTVIPPPFPFSRLYF